MWHQQRPHRFQAIIFAALVGIAALALACGSSGSKTVERLFSPQNEELDVYDLTTGQMTVLIPVDGWVNGQVCLVPGGSDKLLMAEDKDEEKGVRSGWSIFSGNGTFERKIAEPSSPTNEPEKIDPMGCAFDSEKRLFVTDVGAEDFTAASGKLILFFPPDYATYCILNDTLRTAGPVAIDDDGSVLVAESVPPGDILRYSQPFPKDATACASTPVNSSTFIKDANLATPAGIARAPNGNWYVSSVFVPTAISEYDQNGTFVRAIASGQDIGNPEGIAVDSKGTIYYADLGLEIPPGGGLPGPAHGKGTVRKIAFDKDGKPLPPETIGSGLSFPDAVSTLTVKQ